MVTIRRIARLGEILIREGLITPAQLEEALKMSKRTGTRLGETLISMGLVTEEDVARALSNQLNIPYISLTDLIIDPHIIRLIPEALARRYNVIPFSMEGDTLKVAMVDPLDVFAVDELKKASGHQVLPAVATRSGVQKAIDHQYYGMQGTLEEVVRRIEATGLELLKEEEADTARLERIAGEASIIQLVNLLISQAIKERASDIHIEPDEDTLRVRMRIDGILHEVSNLPLRLHPAIVSRVKILGDMNIAEKRLPQDGRFDVKVGTHDVDVRVSTLPTIFGEKVALRLLDKTSFLLKLEELTPLADTLEILKTMVRRPYGMVLLTGPTGSGKTTTAYTLLSMINTMQRNIVTVEDPVEYHLRIINQVQVNPKIGVSFANTLRHVLRQDPDIIMIGEIRDRETAEIAIHAALTGHLVISTIHTNNAIGTITRLLDIGVEPFLVASSVICLVGQRLVRGICPRCKVAYKPNERLLQELGFSIKGQVPNFYRGQGCPACKGTGLKGRMGIFEILVVDDDIRKLILEKRDSSTILSAAIKKGFKTLRYEGIRAVVKGYTTIEEILQATQEIE